MLDVRFAADRPLEPAVPRGPEVGVLEGAEGSALREVGYHRGVGLGPVAGPEQGHVVADHRQLEVAMERVPVRPSAVSPLVGEGVRVSVVDHVSVIPRGYSLRGFPQSMLMASPVTTRRSGLRTSTSVVVVRRGVNGAAAQARGSRNVRMSRGLLTKMSSISSDGNPRALIRGAMCPTR